jgi:hypothetical protein
MSKHRLYDEATETGAEDGEVTLDGPDGVAISMTPEAARETSDRLMDSAAEAAGQRRFANLARDVPK